MTDQISHSEAHEMWSKKQLTLFHKMSPIERLNAVKSGALEHWTEATRAAALDLLGDKGTKALSSPAPRSRRFEAARHPLPPQSVRTARMDWFVSAATGGWTVVMLATAAHAYGLY